MNLCSMVILTRPQRLTALQRELGAIDGLEIHAVDPGGKIVVTVEQASDRHFSQAVMRVSELNSVLSSAVVYHYRDPEDETTAPPIEPPIPPTLNSPAKEATR